MNAKRRPFNVVTVAFANKMTRTIWAVLAHGTPYNTPMHNQLDHLISLSLIDNLSEKQLHAEVVALSRATQRGHPTISRLRGCVDAVRATLWLTLSVDSC